MTVAEVIRERFSVKKFLDTPLEREKLEAILEAGRIAPTAKNLQPQKVYVAESGEALEKLKGLTPCTYGAPTVLIITYDTAVEWHHPEFDDFHSGKEDASIAATQMMLAAWELGIGSCWVNFFPPEGVKKAFDLPESEEVLLLLPLGYAPEDAKALPSHTDKRPMEEMVKYL